MCRLAHATAVTAAVATIAASASVSLLQLLPPSMLAEALMMPPAETLSNLKYKRRRRRGRGRKRRRRGAPTAVAKSTTTTATTKAATASTAAGAGGGDKEENPCSPRHLAEARIARLGIAAAEGGDGGAKYGEYKGEGGTPEARPVSAGGRRRQEQAPLPLPLLPAPSQSSKSVANEPRPNHRRREADLISMTLVTGGRHGDGDGDGDEYVRRSHQYLEPLFDLPVGLASHRIINGDNVSSRDRHPYIVDLGCCAGTLIAPDYVLTAAHCVECMDQVALVGRYEKSNWSERFEEREIVAVWSHDLWDPPNTFSDYDVAVCILGQSSTVTPVALNKNANLLSEGDSCTVVGWGLTESGEFADILQSAKVKYDENCGYFGDQGWITPRMLCAVDYSTPVKDACNGDSGGPLIVESGSLVSGGAAAGDVQVGILSWGEEFPCNEPDKPAVYTRISRVYGWIEDQVCLGSKVATSDLGKLGFSCPERVASERLGDTSGGAGGGDDEVEISSVGTLTDGDISMGTSGGGRVTNVEIVSIVTTTSTTRTTTTVADSNSVGANGVADDTKGNTQTTTATTTARKKCTKTRRTRKLLK